MKVVVDELRQEGVKVGLLRLRTFRPFPVEEIQKALSKVRAIAVLDKSMSFGGNGGAVFQEVRHALYDLEIQPYVINYIYGLGGRDTSPKEFRKIYEELARIQKTDQVGKSVRYLGLRE
jgi:pyruvate ferredoxin oxidoreductase alpha subunit